MKLTNLKVLVVVIFAMLSIQGFSQNEKGKVKAKKEIKTVRFKSDMPCQSCANTVKENIAYEKGVKDLEVSLEENIITIKYKSHKTSEEKLAKAIEKLGYKAEKIEKGLEKSEAIEEAKDTKEKSNK